ncbi:pentatricopeptide repeat-containing protein 2, mitochondrial-like [Babylonia areolata]|uniref:pentatricopeptide repeat-containing protein 2, mitochondrial-like n=1 Tax=Babylonia areolata TaxID=304850 RepID=UPI003FD3C290
MAFFGRVPWRSCILSSELAIISVKRHLFSSEILGVENFKRIRIFEKDRLSNKTDFVQRLWDTSHGGKIEDGHIVSDLVKLMYVADSETEVALATALLKQLYISQTGNQGTSADIDTHSQRLIAEGPLSPKRFQFGPLLFRLLYVLKRPAAAHSLYSDKDLKGLFRNTTCHLLLMDMAYEEGRYRQVVDTFTALQLSGLSASFTPDCTTVAMAALYQLNCKESCQEMKRLVGEARTEGKALSRRCLLFAAALALRQREAPLAVDIAQSLISSNEAIFKNIKLMALAQLGQLEEVLTTMEKGLRGNNPTSFRSGILYSDTVQRLTDHFSVKGNSELEAKFKLVLAGLDAEGLLSPQNVEHFVSRPILRQKKAKTSQSFKTRLKSPIKVKYNVH